jgi:hypothetical protein
LPAEELVPCTMSTLAVIFHLAYSRQYPPALGVHTPNLAAKNSKITASTASQMAP